MKNIRPWHLFVAAGIIGCFILGGLLLSKPTTQIVQSNGSVATQPARTPGSTQPIAPPTDSQSSSNGQTPAERYCEYLPAASTAAEKCAVIFLNHTRWVSDNLQEQTDLIYVGTFTNENGGITQFKIVYGSDGIQISFGANNDTYYGRIYQMQDGSWVDVSGQTNEVNVAPNF